uniref:Immunoglobulin V-set domain-containing protein n=1 Tax=Gopherus evgoodei TaxID=1825980 RepID=A0A8C4WRI2_9SAUR
MLGTDTLIADCFSVLCFPLCSIGQADAKITQTPSLVLERGHPITDRFQADQPQNDLFRLKIYSVQPEDSAVYFCTSSLDTVLQSSPPPTTTTSSVPCFSVASAQEAAGWLPPLEATRLILWDAGREAVGEGWGHSSRVGITISCP